MHIPSAARECSESPDERPGGVESEAGRASPQLLHVSRTETSGVSGEAAALQGEVCRAGAHH